MVGRDGRIGLPLPARCTTKTGFALWLAIVVSMASGTQGASQTSGASTTKPATETPLQVASARANALQLYVVNEGDAPVALAEVRVTHGMLLAVGRTDSSGIFRAEGLIPGEWRAQVRRVGYGEAAVDLHVNAGENAFTVTVAELNGALTDVRVVGERVSSLRLRDFEARRKQGIPSAVITRAEIVKRNPVSLSQMLRGLPGVQVSDQNGTKVAVAARSSVPQGGAPAPCPMRMSVDGILLPPLSNLDDVVPGDVHGIEVYYGPGRLPSQLATFRADKWCGLIAVWTRDR